LAIGADRRVRLGHPPHLRQSQAKQLRRQLGRDPVGHIGHGPIKSTLGQGHQVVLLGYGLVPAGQGLIEATGRLTVSGVEGSDGALRLAHLGADGHR